MVHIRNSPLQVYKHVSKLQNLLTSSIENSSRPRSQSQFPRWKSLCFLITHLFKYFTCFTIRLCLYRSLLNLSQFCVRFIAGTTEKLPPRYWRMEWIRGGGWDVGPEGQRVFFLWSLEVEFYEINVCNCIVSGARK